MREKDKSDICHILKGIAQRGVISGDMFKVRQNDLDRIWEIVQRSNGDREHTTTDSSV